VAIVESATRGLRGIEGIEEEAEKSCSSSLKEPERELGFELESLTS